MNEVCVSLPIPPASLSPNGRAHWQQVARDKAAYRKQAWAELLDVLPDGMATWLGPVHLHAVWQVPNRRWLPDLDNATARLQPVINAGADAGLYLDDKQISGITVERVVGPRGLTVTFSREEQP